MKRRKEVLRPLDSDAFDGMLYLPYDPEDSGERFPTVYLLGSDENEARSIASFLKAAPPRNEPSSAIVALHPRNWASDYSPLSAPALRKGDAPFLPGAGAHLAGIVETLIPSLEADFPLLSIREYRTLAGYSLAGLCALFGAYRCPDVFSRFAVCSASVWMEGWMDFMTETPLPRKDIRLYLSLGKKEPITKNPRLARVGRCFEEASAILSASLPADRFLSEWNNGGHFSEPDRRLARGLAFLSRDI